MRLVDPNLSKQTKILAYTVFFAVLAAVLTLGIMSIANSLSRLSNVQESIADFKQTISEEMNQISD
jgi:cell division protein FtsL